MEWVKIKDDESNLPEAFKDVLVTTAATGAKYVCIMYYDLYTKAFINSDGISYEINEIAAYMYLPEPFKE